MKRTVTILGATGSVGQSTLDLIERDRGKFDVLALTARRDVAGLASAARRVGARRAVIADESLLDTLKDALVGTEVKAAAGQDAIVEAAASGADWTMAARSEEHTSELQSLMRLSYAVFCLTKTKHHIIKCV